jgi:hypothetical protein
LVTATATIIVCIAIMMPTEPTSNQRAAAISFRLASHTYIKCSLASAARLAFQFDIPELPATAAMRQCAEKGKQLRQLAIPLVGEGGSLHIMLEVDDLIRRHVRTIVVAIREGAEAQ